ncbi:MAG: hypothetical protein AAF799_18185 [Myxococcota bacterium]
MRFWDSGIVVDLLILAFVLGIAMVLIRSVGVLRRLALPNAIVAGLIGLLLGPSALGVLPTDIEAMELIVYHAFAVIFIAVGLQATPKTERPGSARSLAVANASIGVLQAILGLLFVAVWLTFDDSVHSGFGFLVTEGFQQGPGQALTLGKGWEDSGMQDGVQLGLIFATLGFLYCIVLGIPMVAIARRKGLIGPLQMSEEEAAETASASTDAQADASLEPLSTQLIMVGCVYLLVFVFIEGIVSLLPPGAKLSNTAYAMHFIFGSLFAIGLRYAARRTKREGPFRDDMLARISVVAVDITTAGAISAVSLDVLQTWLVPVLLMTVMAGGLTLLGCLWLARRAFPESPFGHTLVLFGMGTGTVSTGLALLRMLDPELRGTVARNAVIGATVSVPFNAPMFVVVIPLAFGLSSQGPLVAVGGPLAMLVVYLLVLIACWQSLTPLRVLRPLRSLWPPDPDE